MHYYTHARTPTVRFCSQASRDGLEQPVFARVDPLTMQVQQVRVQRKQQKQAREQEQQVQEVWETEQVRETEQVQETEQARETELALSAVPGLYAVGPMRGDNFVRYLLGDAFAVVAHLAKTTARPQAQAQPYH